MNYNYNLFRPELSKSGRKEVVWFSVILVVGLSASLIASLFYKESWLWMDEVLGFTLLSDPSLAHMNDAIVSNIDANPPLFFNVYWLLGHTISLSPYFLRAVSIVLFAVTIALLHRYTTRLVGNPVVNFVLITLISSLTYLNYILSTQMRSYSLYLLLSCLYFLVLHKLIHAPGRPRLLVVQLVVGLALAFTHNFGLVYVGASLTFFGVLWLWSGKRAYAVVMLLHGLIFGFWFLAWFSRFQIQAQAGNPHSWIPLPTAVSFFYTLGELIPSVSSRLERMAALSFLPMLRVGLLVGLFLYIALPRLKQGYSTLLTDRAFSFYVLAGYIALAVAGASLVVSYGFTSVFLSRYQWPTSLLVMFQLIYTYHYFRPASWRAPNLIRWMPLYVLGLLGFVFYQNTKVIIFPRAIVNYLPPNQANYPIFVESADYFLPMHHHKLANAHFLLSWQTALSAKNIPNATVDYKILSSFRDKYKVEEIVPANQFDKAHFPHFYVVDEASRHQIESFVSTGRVKVIRTIPVPIQGHQLLECTF